MKELILEPLNIIKKDNHYTRQCLVKRTNNKAQTSENILWFQFPDSIKPPEDNDCDSYLLAVIMDAMQENRDIIIKGATSKELLSNLIEYQAAWNKWLPKVFNIIEIESQGVREREFANSDAVCAFSGGVDAVFSLWMHTQKKLSHRTHKIKLSAFVHGLDIPLSNNIAFENTINKARKTVESINLKLVPIKTNAREISGVSWGYAFLCVLIASLSNLKNIAGVAIYGSSYPYDKLVYPWGSSPITDHLLSSGDFKVMLDGCSHNRPEKIREIADWNIAMKNLQVCWEGNATGQNCGKCEKCLRTKYNFLAVNKEIPDCFPKNIDSLSLLNKILPRIEGNRAEWEQIYKYAKLRGIKTDWVNILPKILNKKTTNMKKTTDLLFPEGSRLRIFIRKTLKMFRKHSN